MKLRLKEQFPQWGQIKGFKFKRKTNSQSQILKTKEILLFFFALLYNSALHPILFASDILAFILTLRCLCVQQQNADSNTTICFTALNRQKLLCQSEIKCSYFGLMKII